jgi:hypothetical protein
MVGIRGRAAMADRSEEAWIGTSGRSAAGAKESARHLGDQMRDAMASLIEEQKERMAAAVQGLAETLRQTADTLERDAKPAAAQYADQAAAQIDRLSARVRQQHWQDMVAQLEGFARRQPQLFLTGAVAAGFIIGRILAQPTGERRGGDGLQPSGEQLERTGYGTEEPLAGYGAGGGFPGGPA